MEHLINVKENERTLTFHVIRIVLGPATIFHLCVRAQSMKAARSQRRKALTSNQMQTAGWPDRASVWAGRPDGFGWPAGRDEPASQDLAVRGRPNEKESLFDWGIQLCDTADMPFVSYSRHVCRVTQRTCVLCNTTDMSVV